MNVEEQNFIKTYVQPPQIPLTIQRIGSEHDNLFGVKDRKRDIKYFLKNQINYSYKKGSSTTLRGGSKIIKYQQSIFSSRVLADILNSKLIINIDECVFNRDLKKQYSWLPKGITSPIINTIATGRCWMITAIWSNGEFLSLIVNNTGNSSKFCDFLWIIKYAMGFTKMSLNRSCLLILDNATTHYSDQTTKTLKRLWFCTMYLLAYSPILAPVELFV